MEEAEFAQRVAQPLLLQGPVQAVLLDLFQQLQAQAGTISGLQLSMSTLDAREREARQAAAAAEQRAHEAIREMEAQVTAERQAAEQARAETEFRLHSLELLLHGTSNMAGRQSALDDIASMLGVSVPEVEPPPVEAVSRLGSRAASRAHSFRPTSSNAAAAETHSAAADNVRATGVGSADEQQRTASAQGAAAFPPAAHPAAGHASPLQPPRPSSSASQYEPPDTSEVIDAGTATAAATSAPQAAAGASGSRPSSSANGSSDGSWSAGSEAAYGSVSGHLGNADHSTSPAQGSSTRSAADLGAGAPIGDAHTAVPTVGVTAGMPGQPDAPCSQLADGEMPLADSTLASGGSASDHCAAASPPTSDLSAAATQGACLSPAPLPAVAASRAGASVTRLEVPSPSALFAAMQAGKAKAAGMDQPLQPACTASESAAPAAAAAQRSPTPTVFAKGRLAQQEAAPSGAWTAATAAAAGVAQKALRSSSSRTLAREAAAVASDDENAAANAWPKSAAARLAEVVHMLQKRPSIKQTGLLWRLQASLAESVDEQERLKGELAALQQQLDSVQATTGEGLERCSQRIDGMEEMVAAGGLPESSSSDGAPTARSLTPRVSVHEFKALEERVQAGEARLAALDAGVKAGVQQVSALGGEVKAGAKQLCGLDGQVQSGEKRLARLEELQAAEAAAVKLVRASSSGSSEDTLAALQRHLLAQQQKLQAHMESLAAGIKQALPGEVHDAVTGAVVEVGRGLERRLAEKLATKQDLQTLSIKVGSKVSREEVERMLRTHRASFSAQTAEPGSGPAAGMRFKCISCDTHMQPFVFAAPHGALPFTPQYPGGTADLRYSQLPVASPARNSSQPWTSAVSPVATGAAPAPESSHLGSAASMAGAAGGGGSASQLPAAHVQLPAAPLSARASTGASRLGAPVSWMHRMRRETGAGSSLDGGSRRESMQEHQHQHQLQHQPSLTAVAIARPQTAFPLSTLRGGGGPAASPPQQASEVQVHREADGAGTDFFEAIREEPQLAGAGSSLATAAGLPAEEQEAGGPHSARGSLSSGGSAKGAALLPALAAGSQGRIKAVRPATAMPPGRAAGGAADAAEGMHRQSSTADDGSSGPGGKRRSTGMTGSTPL